MRLADAGRAEQDDVVRALRERSPLDLQCLPDRAMMPG
jgi:hypothetical protein